MVRGRRRAAPAALPASGAATQVRNILSLPARRKTGRAASLPPRTPIAPLI